MATIEQYVARLTIGEFIGTSVMENFLDILNESPNSKRPIATFNLHNQNDIKTKDLATYIQNHLPKKRKRTQENLSTVFITFGNGITHFRVVYYDSDWIAWDPYNDFQKPGSQGYCQTFALIKAMTIAGFKTPIEQLQHKKTQLSYLQNSYIAHNFAKDIIINDNNLNEYNKSIYETIFPQLKTVMPYEQFKTHLNFNFEIFTQITNLDD